MSEVLKEFGKAILQFANIIGGLVLFKAFIETNTIFMLILAIAFLIVFYVIGLYLINKGASSGNDWSNESK